MLVTLPIIAHSTNKDNVTSNVNLKAELTLRYPLQHVWRAYPKCNKLVFHLLTISLHQDSWTCPSGQHQDNTRAPRLETVSVATLNKMKNPRRATEKPQKAPGEVSMQLAYVLA